MLDYKTVPNQNMVGAIQRYIEHGISPGGWMTSVLSNDLKGAVAHADGMNKATLARMVEWLFWEFPSNAWGSPEIVADWIKQGGMKSD